MTAFTRFALLAVAAGGAVYGARVPCRTSGMLATSVVGAVGVLTVLTFRTPTRSPRAQGIRLAGPYLAAFGTAGLLAATLAWLLLGRGTCHP